MKLISPNHLVVSRRNLLTLLAKLDGSPEGSACTILGGEDAPDFYLHAEPDAVHYADRVPGRMHSDTEGAILLARATLET
jgi:hypothetical protein